MLQQFKKIITVIFAILFGVAVVYLALSKNSIFGTKVIMDNNVSAHDAKWRDSLTVIPQLGPSRLLGTEYAQSEATSTTDYIANEVVMNYARTQVNKGSVPLDDADVQNIVQAITEKTRAVDTVKQYGEQDFIVVPSSSSTIAMYQNESTTALSAFAQKNKVNELTFIAQALESNDASKLAPISENIANYQMLVNDLLATHVPRTALVFHTSLVQGYANMLAGISDMQEIIADPVRGMRGIAKYNNGAGLIDTAVAMLHTQK